MAVEQSFVVLHVQIGREAFLKPAIEVDQVRIGVIEQRACWQKPQGDGQATTKRLHEPRPGMPLPQGEQVWHLPSLSARPFQGRPESGRADVAGIRQST